MYGNDRLLKITKTFVSDSQNYFRMCFIETNDTGIIFYIEKFFMLYCLTLHVVLLIVEWPERISDRAFAVVIATTYVLVAITTLQWYLKRDEIFEKIRNVDNCIIFENEKIINIVSTDNKFRRTVARLIFFSMQFLAVFAVSAWLYEFLFDYEKYYKITENGNATSRKYTQRFLVQMWVPFDSTASRMKHFIDVMLNMPPFLFVAVSISGVDSLFIGLTTYACTHFKILKYFLKNITESETDRILISNYGNLRSEDKIKAAVNYLDRILEFCNSLKGFYDILILYQILWAVGFFGVNLMSVSYLPVTDPMFLENCFMTVIGTVERIFLCCYYGNKLTATAEEIHVALYKCNWIEASKSFNKSLLIMMMRMGKPVILTVGGIYPLTLQTFVEILRGGYSVALLMK